MHIAGTCTLSYWLASLCRLDPDGAMVAFADMMRKQIVMPAHLMDDNEHAANNGGKRNLFNDYSEVAEHLGG